MFTAHSDGYEKHLFGQTGWKLSRLLGLAAILGLLVAGCLR